MAETSIEWATPTHVLYPTVQTDQHGGGWAWRCSCRGWSTTYSSPARADRAGKAHVAGALEAAVGPKAGV